MSTSMTHPAVGIDSGQVMTVLGPLPVSAMGVTLVHEHTLVDTGVNGPEPVEAARAHLFHRPLTMDILGQVRAMPQSNRDNQRMGDISLVSTELREYAIAGGTTIVDATVEGIGRDPLGVQQVSRASGVNIILGAGFYIELSHPVRLRSMSIDDVADEVVRDLTEGIEGTGVRAGIIGEIGIDKEYSSAEEKNLRASARASQRTHVPLNIHSIGVSGSDIRRRVVDTIQEEGADLRHTIMGHMTLRPFDLDFQQEIAERGVYLGYDTISTDFNWGQRGSGLCDHEIADNIRTIIDGGYLDRIVLSMDIHMKIMLTAYGGGGYGYLLRDFLPRLRERAISNEQIKTMLVDNPRRLFSSNCGT